MISVSVRDLFKSYGGVHALNGLTLHVDAGSVFGFLGPNGAGKTTTLRLLAGLARADSGSIIFGDRSNRQTLTDQKAVVGYLPEEPAFYPWMSPLETLDFVGKIFKLEKKERLYRAEKLLEQSGLKEAAKRRVAGFSRGMRQRLGIAQALMNKPAILLLDEPVSALDPAGRKEVLEMIEALGRECTVIMSSHILADVERVCDTISIIHQGRLALQSRKEELLSRYAIPALELTVSNGYSAQLPEWKKRLESLPGVSGATVDGYTIHLAVKDVFIAQRQIMQDAFIFNVHFDRLEVVKPSLEDIFLQLTGSQK